MKKEELEKRLRELPESLREEGDISLAEKGLAELKLRQKEKKRGWNRPWIWAVASCCVLLAIILPISLSLTRQPTDDTKFYSEDQLEKQVYSSIKDYNTTAQTELLNLSNFQAEVQCYQYFIKETSQVGFLEEFAEIMTDEKYLSIDFFAVPGKDQFGHFDTYVGTESLIYEGITILYEQTLENEFFYHIKARFEVTGNQYYLDLQTLDPNDLDFCLNIIFNSI